jgi:hypothetical protein
MTDPAKSCPRVPPSPNSLAVAASRRNFIGAALLAPIGFSACTAEPAPSGELSPLAAQWEIDRQHLQAIDIFPDETDDADYQLWEKVSAVETIILESPARSIADTIAKLKVALLHAGEGDWVDAALIAGEDETLFARADDLDMTPRLIVGAIEALIKLGREA